MAETPAAASPAGEKGGARVCLLALFPRDLCGLARCSVLPPHPRLGGREAAAEPAVKDDDCLHDGRFVCCCARTYCVVLGRLLSLSGHPPKGVEIDQRF